MRQRRDKIESKKSGDGSHPDAWSVDDAYRYLTRVAGFQDDVAVYELNQKFEQGRLHLHWRRTDSAGLGQEEDVPATSWRLRLLCVACDRNRDQTHGPADWATGKVTANDDGRAFVQILEAEDRDAGCTYDLTVRPQDVQMLWPTQAQAASKPRRTKHESFVAAIEARIAAGYRPGGSEQWPRFCDRVRESCGVKATDWGYSDKSVERLVKRLSK